MTEPPRGLAWSARTRPLSIDVAAIARGTVSSPRPNLVTRPTGRAVREAIEARLVHITRSLSVALIDLTRVRILDFSCADEVVAKLLLRYLEPDRPGDTFFLFRTVGDLHRHAVGRSWGGTGWPPCATSAMAVSSFSARRPPRSAPRGPRWSAGSGFSRETSNRHWEIGESPCFRDWPHDGWHIRPATEAPRR